ncbi:MAG: response regulator [Defluviitaleaceae bacterium]|nr:response regulator [Defluviitaleaceae bacterium]
MNRMFFVDDEPLVLKGFMSSPVFLECGYVNEGYATDPNEAIGMIRDYEPDVVFTDLKMPGMNGVDMMQRLRRTGYGGEFIIISAFGEFEESRRFFKLGGFDYLIKPVTDRELRILLRSLSEKLRSHIKNIKPLDDTASPEVNKIIEYLNKNKIAKHTLESVGAKFNLKPNHICKLFSRHLHMTFVSYITRIKMEEAANLLKNTEKTIKEVATLCGYPDYFYFCRVFKEVHNSTPSLYRETAT